MPVALINAFARYLRRVIAVEGELIETRVWPSWSKPAPPMSAPKAATASIHARRVVRAVPWKALVVNRPQTALRIDARVPAFPRIKSRVGIFVFMTDSDNCRAEGAIQMLVWAIEEIAKTGNKNAERHARSALKLLQDKVPDERPTSSTLQRRSAGR